MPLDFSEGNINTFGRNGGRVDSLWFSALFLCMAYWWMRKDPPLFMPPSSHVVYNYVYKFMVAGVAIAAFIPLFKYYVNKPLLIFTKWGGVTLGIYAIHQTIITLLTSWFNIASLRLPYWLYVCCLWVMVSAISYLCYRLIERNRYLSLLFLGK